MIVYGHNINMVFLTNGLVNENGYVTCIKNVFDSYINTVLPLNDTTYRKV
jgi:hypothetical protein